MTTGILLLALVMVTVLPVAAQPGDPQNPDAPIGGIEILVAAGSLLGVRKLLRLRKKKGKSADQ